jgi:DNA repair protein RecN (Recombination protein N)
MSVDKSCSMSYIGLESDFVKFTDCKDSMLTAISIRDVVLIDKLDLAFGPGLTVLTGETGAGKSILLGSLGLALGQRAESGLVRAGAEQASISVEFSLSDVHPVLELLAEQGLDSEDNVVLRRVLTRDGKSRAFVNDQPVGLTMLRRIGALLVEVQGQNEQVGLADPAGHGTLLDAYGVNHLLRTKVSDLWRRQRDAESALRAARAAIAEAEREQDWLEHAAAELTTLAPQDGEEDELASERTLLQQGERRAEAVASALSEITPRDRRSGPGPAAALRAASRALSRLGSADEEASLAFAALEQAADAVMEAENLLARLGEQMQADPQNLEHVEERLFALRAAARKHTVTVSELPSLLASLQQRLQALETGTAEITMLEQVSKLARVAYAEAATELGVQRRTAAVSLEKAVTAELPPLRLDKARFHVDVASLPEERHGSTGMDSIRFLIATNPGQAPGPLDRVASGGELSRLMLALKVVLISGSTIPTLVFDEVDSGIGGATAAAVGERLARVSEQVQVLVVTHSPQVAARGISHLRVSKTERQGRAETTVAILTDNERREEVARMLAGENITEAARSAADSLLSVCIPV